MPPVKQDITVADGLRIAKEAAAWKDTPYVLNGEVAQKGTGGDCSGTTWAIYKAAGFPFAYRSTATFPTYATTSGLFRKLKDKDARQDGDILWWSGHVAIWAKSSLIGDPVNSKTERINAKGKKWLQINDIWTATRPGGPAYMPHEQRWFRPEAPTVYRYQK